MNNAQIKSVNIIKLLYLCNASVGILIFVVVPATIMTISEDCLVYRYSDNRCIAIFVFTLS